MSLSHLIILHCVKSVRMQENADQKISENLLFSRSVAFFFWQFISTINWLLIKWLKTKRKDEPLNIQHLGITNKLKIFWWFLRE